MFYLLTHRMRAGFAAKKIMGSETPQDLIEGFIKETKEVVDFVFSNDHDRKDAAVWLKEFVGVPGIQGNSIQVARSCSIIDEVDDRQ